MPIAAYFHCAVFRELASKAFFSCAAAFVKARVCVAQPLRFARPAVSGLDFSLCPISGRDSQNRELYTP